MLNVVTMLQRYHIDLLQKLNRTVELLKPVSELLGGICATALSHCTILTGGKYGVDGGGSAPPLVDVAPVS